MLKFFRTFLRLAARAVMRPTGWLDLLGDFGRGAVSTVVLLLAAAVVRATAGEGWETSATAGWDAAAAVYLGLTWAFVVRSTPERTRRWAASQDSPRARVLQTVLGRAFGLGMVVLVSLVGLASGTGLAPQDDQGELTVALSALAVIEAWLVLQVSYGLYYAYLYYRPGENDAPAGGLEFPGEGKEPGMADFVYFAAAIGTAFAVSDVRVLRTDIRRVVIGHSILSFAYNAAFLTLAFGVVLGNS